MVGILDEMVVLWGMVGVKADLKWCVGGVGLYGGCFENCQIANHFFLFFCLTQPSQLSQCRFENKSTTM